MPHATQPTRPVHGFQARIRHDTLTLSIAASLLTQEAKQRIGTVGVVNYAQHPPVLRRSAS